MGKYVKSHALLDGVPRSHEISFNSGCDRICLSYEDISYATGIAAGAAENKKLRGLLSEAKASLDPNLNVSLLKDIEKELFGHRILTYISS